MPDGREETSRVCHDMPDCLRCTNLGEHTSIRASCRRFNFQGWRSDRKLPARGTGRGRPGLTLRGTWTARGRRARGQAAGRRLASGETGTWGTRWVPRAGLAASWQRTQCTADCTAPAARQTRPPQRPRPQATRPRGQAERVVARSAAHSCHRTTTAWK